MTQFLNERNALLNMVTHLKQKWYDRAGRRANRAMNQYGDCVGGYGGAPKKGDHVAAVQLEDPSASCKQMQPRTKNEFLRSRDGQPCAEKRLVSLGRRPNGSPSSSTAVQ